MNSRVDKFTLQMLSIPEHREGGSLTVKRDFPCGIYMDNQRCACEVCMDQKALEMFLDEEEVSADLSDTSSHIKMRKELRKA